jgi:hypothetical protein
MTTGYGAEMSCTDSLRTGRIVRGARLVAEAAYRRITTPRGDLQGVIESDPDLAALASSDEESAYGFDVADFVGEVGTDAAVASLPVLLASELLKDDRIQSADVDVFVEHTSSGEDNITISVDVQLVDAGESFAFTANVAGGEVTLLVLESSS